MLLGFLIITIGIAITLVGVGIVITAIVSMVDK
jgi:hypothetical protein